MIDPNTVVVRCKCFYHSITLPPLYLYLFMAVSLREMHEGKGVNTRYWPYSQGNSSEVFLNHSRKALKL